MRYHVFDPALNRIYCYENASEAKAHFDRIVSGTWGPKPCAVFGCTARLHMPQGFEIRARAEDGARR